MPAIATGSPDPKRNDKPEKEPVVTFAELPDTGCPTDYEQCGRQQKIRKAIEAFAQLVH